MHCRLYPHQVLFALVLGAFSPYVKMSLSTALNPILLPGVSCPTTAIYRWTNVPIEHSQVRKSQSSVKRHKVRQKEKIRETWPPVDEKWPKRETKWQQRVVNNQKKRQKMMTKSWKMAKKRDKWPQSWKIVIFIFTFLQPVKNNFKKSYKMTTNQKDEPIKKPKE